jgi:class 3 adenylate cyclase/energy-coupling factor transporter ATP-binding protein EcfA2
VRCPVCNQENPAGARFCLACGVELQSEAPPQEERRIVSIIFVDLVGSTAQAEALDPEDVRALLTPYHQVVRREIESFGGVVEKFIGDAIMGVFGAPVAYGDDAERAVRAAFVVRDSVCAMPGSNLQIRIAVNTGEAVVSLNARPALGESMVAGDVVNTASRLQSQAPVNGIVVGEMTYLGTRDVIAYEETEAIVAKGKAAPVKAWVATQALTPAGQRVTRDLRMVGRVPELRLLAAILDRVLAERQPHLVSIFGPAGVGKSTIVSNFAEIANERSARVVFGRSLPYRESSVYGPLSRHVMGICGIYESDTADVMIDKLRRRTKELLAGSSASAETVAEHLGAIVGVDGFGAEATDRDILFSSTRLFMEAAARERPTVLVFEDIHWSGSTLLDLIDALAVGTHGLPLLLVTLARPEFLDARDSWGGRLASYTSLTLGPLAESDARELAVRRLGGPDRADAVVRVAEGNPLFIEQLAATIGETEGALPTSIRGLVAARLDALPPRDRALLLDAAVVGKVFWYDALLALSTDPDIDGVLEELERRDLIRREAGSLIENQQQFTFTHVLIRDVAYELLPRADRARRHAAVADFFERSTGASSEAIGALAHHWRDAGDFERAIEQLTRAAEQAERGWAKDHAAVLYREALGLVPEDDAERRSALRRRLAVASTASFHLDDVRRPGSLPA